MSQRRFFAIVQRVSTPGVLVSGQLGVVVHSLRRLDALEVVDRSQLAVINTLIGRADAHTVANVLHNVALTTREQLDPHFALPAHVQDSLSRIQDSLFECIDDLSAVECVLATEALVHLMPFGQAVLNASLLEELQERTRVLVAAVERPVELLGILRVAMEAYQQPHGNTEGASAQLRAWSEVVLPNLLATVEGQLCEWRKNDLIALVDCLTLRVAPPTDADTFTAASPRRKHVLDVARPLLVKLLDRTSDITRDGQLSPSQVSAWVVRTVQLELYSGHHLLQDLLPFIDAPHCSLSQLASTAQALGQVLADDASMTTFDRSDQDALVQAYVGLLAELVSRLDECPTHRGDRSQGPMKPRHTMRPALALREFLLPVLARVPESAVTAYGGRYADHHGPGSQQCLACLACTLERGCSLLLRHYQALLSADTSLVAGIALHWQVFGTAPGVATTLMCSSTTRTNRQPPPASQWLLREHLTLSPEVTQRKLMALSGIIRERVPDLQVADAANVLNEAVFFLSRGHEGRLPTSSLSGAAEDVRDTCMALHTSLQSTPAAALATLPTYQLVRYLTSMSKLGIRTSADYAKVIGLFRDRHLTGNDLGHVLVVMARHRVRSSFILREVVRRMPQLAVTLTPATKAVIVHNLGRVGGHRFIEAPLFAPLDGSAFFNRAEVDDLDYLEAVLCFVGLVRLRQYEGTLLQWLLEGPLRRVPPLEGIAGIRSSATVTELAVALCRCGLSDSPHIGLLLCCTLQSLAQRLPTSASLFTDVRILAEAWHFFSCNGTTVYTNLSPEECTACNTAWSQVVASAAAAVRPRLLDVSEDSDLRPSSFLYPQLAAGVLFNALPAQEAVDRLISQLRLEKLTLPTNTRQYIHATVVALFCISHNPAKAAEILGFIQSRLATLGVQEGMAVCWHLHCFEMDTPLTSSCPAEIRATVRAMLTELQAAQQQPGSTKKLSLAERRLRDTLV